MLFVFLLNPPMKFIEKRLFLGPAERAKKPRVRQRLEKMARPVSLVLAILLGKRKVDRKELREYMNSLPPKVRRWSYWKLAVKLWNKIKKRLRLMGSGAKVENVS